MNNFYTYIAGDIEIKKEIISTMPDKTKTNIKNKIEKVQDIEKKYLTYNENVKKYIDVKSKVIELKDPEAKEDISKYLNRIEELQSLKKILTPINTYYEKLNLDSLLYELTNYADFDFPTLNGVIAKFIKKFELINVTLTEKDFNISCYVNEYMTEFLNCYNANDLKYTSVEPVFERIYWVNPNIISHIDLNFRKLIKKYENKFKGAVADLQEEYKKKCGVYSYEDCVRELRRVHYECMMKSTESINDIIQMANNEEIDVNDFFEDSKAMSLVYTTLVDKNVVTDQSKKEKIEIELLKLKNIVKEYKNFNEFVPFIEASKESYTSFKIESSVDELEDKIDDLEEELNKINSLIYGKPVEEDFNIKKAFKFIEKKTPVEDKPVKQLQADSIKICNDLLELYQNVDSIYFYNRCKVLMEDYVTLDDFLNLYYGYDYFKKKSLKEIFKTNNYEEVIELAKKFDEFSGNPNNVVISSVPVFEEYNVAKVIVNKYRINNINITEENLKPSGIDALLSNLNLFLRSSYINKCNLKPEQLWFIIEANKIKNKKTN